MARFRPRGRHGDVMSNYQSSRGDDRDDVVESNSQGSERGDVRRGAVESKNQRSDLRDDRDVVVEITSEHIDDRVGGVIENMGRRSEHGVVESRSQRCEHRYDWHRVVESRRQRRERRDDDDDERISRRGDRENRDKREKSDRGADGVKRSDGSLREKSGKDDVKEKKEDGSRLQKLADSQEGATGLGKTGGIYIPPFKLAEILKEVEDKSSIEYQRLTWDALRKSINGLVNKVNATNIKNIVLELFSENLIRGRGLFSRSCIMSQMACPRFTDVFAALVAVVNTKFPDIGNLFARRIVLQFKRAYQRKDKHPLLAAVKFIAHLVNQQVLYELIALELLTLLLEKPTDDSVEVAIVFVTECGAILQDLCPRGLHGVFERFYGILHEGQIDKRVQFLIERLLALRRANFQGHPAVSPDLDLVEAEDQMSHEISLDDVIDPEVALDLFKPDPEFLDHEERYENLRKSILGNESKDEESADEFVDNHGDSSEEEDEKKLQIMDVTETNLVNLRRTIYLTIMSSANFEEAGLKLLKIKLEPGQEMEICIMLLECCSQERTYLRYYGLVAQRFCIKEKVYQENFEKCFVQQYSMSHRFETNKLRNVAKFFAHLLWMDALPWDVLAYIRLTKEDTSSSSRIFIKILFQELSEQLGIQQLNERLCDPGMVILFESLFPKDNRKNTRFAINFFTVIGLGGLIGNLRDYLKNGSRMTTHQKTTSKSEESYSSSFSSSSSSEFESSSSGPFTIDTDHKHGNPRKRSSVRESEGDDKRNKRHNSR